MTTYVHQRRAKAENNEREIATAAREGARMGMGGRISQKKRGQF